MVSDRLDRGGVTRPGKKLLRSIKNGVSVGGLSFSLAGHPVPQKTELPVIISKPSLTVQQGRVQRWRNPGAWIAGIGAASL